MIRVEAVAEESLGAELGLVPGTELLSVDGRPVHDFLDWEFLTAEPQFELLARLPNGERIAYDIERPDDLPLGVELEPPRIRRCGNRCDFCFVDGLPEGLRPNLYIRDDDYRLSFRHGNFATLTNLKPADVDRILEYRLSPLYVSVHATDPVIRRRLLRNPRAPDVIAQLRTFATRRIQCHTQIVLQPGVNDGAVLRQSLDDLYRLEETVLSVSVVPVGLTEFSKHQLTREPGRDECRQAVDTVERFHVRARAERGRGWVYGADELYLVADLPLPPAASYDDFDQTENGVGSVRYLESRLAKAAGTLRDLSGRRAAVVTGTAMARLMPQIVPILERETGAAFEIVPVVNDLFGPRVTTAGLLPGQGCRRALADRTDLDLALLPAECLNDRGVFIDDLTSADLAAAVGYELLWSHDFVDVLSN